MELMDKLLAMDVQPEELLAVGSHRYTGTLASLKRSQLAQLVTADAQGLPTDKLLVLARYNVERCLRVQRGATDTDLQAFDAKAEATKGFTIRVAQTAPMQRKENTVNTETQTVDTAAATTPAAEKHARTEKLLDNVAAAVAKDDKKPAKPAKPTKAEKPAKAARPARVITKLDAPPAKAEKPAKAAKAAPKAAKAAKAAPKAKKLDAKATPKGKGVAAHVDAAKKAGEKVLNRVKTGHAPSGPSVRYAGKHIKVLNRDHGARPGTKRALLLDKLLASKTTDEAMQQTVKFKGLTVPVTSVDMRFAIAQGFMELR